MKTDITQTILKVHHNIDLESISINLKANKVFYKGSIVYENEINGEKKPITRLINDSIDLDPETELCAMLESYVADICSIEGEKVKLKKEKQASDKAKMLADIKKQEEEAAKKRLKQNQIPERPADPPTHPQVDEHAE